MPQFFYLYSGSCGASASVVDGVSPLQTFRPGMGDRILGLVTSSTTTTVGGTLIQCTNTAGGNRLAWATAPLMPTVLSGGVSMSIWGRENATNNNCKVGYRVFHKSASSDGTGIETAITNVSSSGTEWTATAANRLMSASYISNVTVARGDRIVVRTYAINVGTMANGTHFLFYQGVTSGSSGDAWVRFSQNIDIEHKIQAF